MPATKINWSRAGTVSACLLFAGCGGSRPGVSAPTFAVDVAPILYGRCVPCHRVDGAAPFPLVRYEDAARRARQIADVTATAYMPPWLPEPGHGSFQGERRLSPSEIEVLRRWADSGAAEGDSEALPPPPVFYDEWELGEPDLVVEMPEAYSLPAEGQDVFRNFVLPVTLDGPRFIEAYELLPNKRRLVHHATITIDRDRASRRLDAAEPGAGFDGMRSAPGVVMPDGHFLGWTPGKSAEREPPGMSWRLDPGSDLVVQLHMPTTGKPEEVSIRIGLFFADVPRSVVPVTLRLGSRHFEIPAGESSFVVEDHYTMPVDVRAFSVYPHAHYLAREMRAHATRPDGSEVDLIRIDDWDFNWQDVYRYREPVSLPRGTVVRMRDRFDNSGANPRNPGRDPVAVAYGSSSADEMADLYLQVVTDTPTDLDVLRGDFTAKELNETRLELDFRLARSPDDADVLNDLGVVYQRLGRGEEALDAVQRSVALDPDNLNANFNLGTLLAARGDHRGALGHFRAALARDPGCRDCRVRLGNVLRDEGEVAAAIEELSRSVLLDPDYAWGRYSLGIAQQIAGRVDDAISEYRRVVALEPDNVDAWLSLGSALIGEKRCTPGVSAMEEAMALAPDTPGPLSRLAWALTQCPNAVPGAATRAVEHASRAAFLTEYRDPDVLETLGDALLATGDRAAARDVWSRAVSLVPPGSVLGTRVRAKLESL